jgi:transcriptional regulator with XRE-family HTH domain
MQPYDGAGAERVQMAKRIEPVDKLVGQNIRIFRMAKGISQTELGNSVGVTFQQIQKYEKGANRVGSSRLAKIAVILKVPISNFFDNAASGSDGPVAGPVVTDLLISPYAVQMLKAFAKLPSDKLRRSLVVLAESIAKSPEI